MFRGSEQMFCMPSTRFRFVFLVPSSPSDLPTPHFRVCDDMFLDFNPVVCVYVSINIFYSVVFFLLIFFILFSLLIFPSISFSVQIFIK